ncbi:DNA cytosine methyltransferase [Variovorax ginsengisoli]|uniref:DNA cytosine methyltransferase n=1 Tax=Variovorax ginsengisoli TaxID=363844 RepID=UPI003455203B
MNELHLFSGAGGGILAGHLLGHRCIGAVEFNPYRRRVLAQRQRDGALPKFPLFSDIRTFDGSPYRGRADIVAGGFPCRPYSSASRGRPVEDDLWPEMRRVVADVAPRYGVWQAEPGEPRISDELARTLDLSGGASK